MKKALIIGMHGFVGRYLQKELESHGYEVYGLSRDGAEKNILHININDREKVQEAIKELSPEYIFHLAGISSPGLAEKERQLTFDTHIEGTRNILDASLLLPTPPKILIVTSSHVYGDPEYVPIDEKHPLLGKGAYAESRIEQEKMVREYFDTLDIIITRSFNHTGPGQPDAFVVPKLVKHVVEIQKGVREFLEAGNLEVKRDILDVEDVVRAYRLLLEGNTFGIICNVCRGEAIRLRDIVDITAQLCNLPTVEVRVNPAFIRPNDPEEVYGDNLLLKNTVAWQVQTPFPDLIQKIYSYWNNTL